MPIARHPKRWWNICMSEDEKREIEPIFTEYPFNVYNLEVLRHFVTQRLDIVKNLYEYLIILTQKVMREDLI